MVLAPPLAYKTPRWSYTVAVKDRIVVRPRHKCASASVRVAMCFQRARDCRQSFGSSITMGCIISRSMTMSNGVGHRLARAMIPMFCATVPHDGRLPWGLLLLPLRRHWLLSTIFCETT